MHGVMVTHRSNSGTWFEATSHILFDFIATAMFGGYDLMKAGIEGK